MSSTSLSICTMSARDAYFGGWLTLHPFTKTGTHASRSQGLIDASEKGDIMMVNALLAAGADKDAKNRVSHGARGMGVPEVGVTVVGMCA